LETVLRVAFESTFQHFNAQDDDFTAWEDRLFSESRGGEGAASVRGKLAHDQCHESATTDAQARAVLRCQTHRGRPRDQYTPSCACVCEHLLLQDVCKERHWRAAGNDDV